MSIYTLPGMADWSFSLQTLRHKGGASYRVTTDSTAQEIAEAVKNIMRGTTYTPDEAAFEVVERAALNIDWHAMLGPYPVAVAPLINAMPTIAVQNSISTELIDELCEHLKAVYYPLQKLRA